MNKITDQQLQTIPKENTWLCDTALSSGHGILCVKLAPCGIKEFYFRYYTKANKRVRLALGYYDSSGKRGLTLRCAREKADQLSALHEAGITNIREHLQQRRREQRA